jgi:hypothetical protein
MSEVLLQLKKGEVKCALLCISYHRYVDCTIGNCFSLCIGYFGKVHFFASRFVIQNKAYVTQFTVNILLYDKIGNCIQVVANMYILPMYASRP